MLSRRSPSKPMRAVLNVLAGTPADWQHGYDLMRLLGLQSGTLYPLLMRLEREGLLEAEWRPSPSPGRPPRHAYRLTASGLRLARDLQAIGNDQPAQPRRATA
jgi:PadR family transcriptional regulator, regulatory protein PadR